MAKKEDTAPATLPRALEPRMFGDGKPSVVAQQAGPSNTAVAGRPARRRSGFRSR